MADELHTPNHRWYEPRNHIALAKEDVSKQWIYDSGIQKIDAWIASQPWGSSVYSVAGFEPALVFDFVNEYYRTGGAVSTFDAAMTHVRSGNATMVYSDGLLKWAPHNLLPYSEDLSNAAWVKTGVTATANTIIQGGLTSAHYVENNSSLGVDGVSFTHEFVIDYVDWRYASVGGNLNGGNRYVIVDLINQTLTETGVGVVTSSIEALSGTRVKVKITAPDVATGGLASYVGFSNSATPGNRFPSFLGDGASSIGVVYSAMYRSDLGGMVDNPDTGNSYVPTTSSARYLPRRGNHVYNGTSWVNAGVLIESEARTNLVTYSNDFTNASWTKTDVSAAASSADFFEITELGSGLQQPSVYANVGLVSGSVYSVSVDVRDVDRGYAFLQWTDVTNRFAINVDLSNGSVTDTYTVGTPNVIGYGVVLMGSGVYRVWISATSATTTGYLVAGLSDSATPTWATNAVPQYSLSGKKIQVRYAQLEAGSTPSSYIPTNAGSTVTRAADTLTMPSANLPWPTPNVIGAELVTNGTFDTDSDWTLQTGWTIGSGSLNFDGTLLYNTATQDIGAVQGRVYKLTFDVLSGAFIQIRLGGATAAFAIGPGNYTTGSYEIIAVCTGADNTLRFVSNTNGDTTAIDNISVREIDPLAVSIQMDGRMTYADTDGNGTVQQFRWYDDASNYIFHRVDTASTQTGKPFWLQAASGVLDTNGGSGTAYSPGINVPFNIASRHGSTFVNGAVDGTALTANTTPTALPDLSATDLNLAPTFMGNIGKLRMWADDLADAGIATATAPSLEPSLSLTFDGSEGSFTVLDWSE